jgi:hypothetical protein
MSPVELAERMKLVMAMLEEMSSDMNTRGGACECCTLVLRENLDDYQAALALEAAKLRIEKLHKKLISGEWKERDIAGVLRAEDVRR